MWGLEILAVQSHSIQPSLPVINPDVSVVLVLLPIYTAGMTDSVGRHPVRRTPAA